MPMSVRASSTSSLSRRIVLWTGVVLFLILAVLAWTANRLLTQRAASAFGVRFRTGEIAGLKNVGELVDSVATYVRQASR
jgi:hypothetical protein